jgi:hypothetical protein
MASLWRTKKEERNENSGTRGENDKRWPWSPHRRSKKLFGWHRDLLTADGMAGRTTKIHVTEKQS